MTISARLTSDLSKFFNTDDFAVAVTFSPGNTYPSRNNDSATINGILDNRFVDINDVSTLEPIFECASADVENICVGSMVENGTTKYRVRDWEPDGTGITVLFLELQP